MLVACANDEQKRGLPDADHSSENRRRQTGLCSQILAYQKGQGLSWKKLLVCFLGGENIYLR